MTWRVRLIHWNAAEAEEKAAPLVAAGYDVAYESINPTTLREMRENPPDVVVIDLTRLPSQGRDIGLLLRKYKTTRHVPLVFVEGDPDKVARIKELLPDAVYSEWSRIHSSLKRAMAHPLKDVVVPESSFAAYAGASLVKKLGIKTNSVIALVNAPQDFEKTLGELPEGSTLRRQARGRCDLILWFPPPVQTWSAASRGSENRSAGMDSGSSGRKKHPASPLTSRKSSCAGSALRRAWWTIRCALLTRRGRACALRDGISQNENTDYHDLSPHSPDVH